MARERTPDTAVVDPPAKPQGRRAGTRTTPTAPLGRPTVEPVVEQMAEGDDVGDVERPDEIDYLNDSAWLFDQVQHALDCPMIGAPFESEAGEPARGQRMEWHDARQPQTTQNPVPRTFRMIACLDCGRRARIQLPRED